MNVRLTRSEKNAIASIYSWMNANVMNQLPGWGFTTQNYEQAWGQSPVLSVTQRPMPELLTAFFDDNIGKSLGGTWQYGTIHQFMLEFNVMAVDDDVNRGAEQQVRLAREVLWDAFWYAGQTSDTNYIMPNIQLLDFDTNPGNPQPTGSYIWWPNEETNTWMETPYMADPQDLMKKRIQMMVRFRWISFRQPGE